MLIQRAFTLAEVLITLGIIAVVTALTIPNLVVNYQKKQWVSQLSKDVAVIESGFRMAMAEDGVDDLGDTELFISLNGSTIASKVIPQEFNTKLKKYFKIIKDTNDITTKFNVEYYLNKQALNNGQKPNARSYYLVDGSIMGLDIDSTRKSIREIKTNGNVVDYFKRDGLVEKSFGSIYIDVNGDKKPNTYGRDIFAFMLGSDGKLYAYGSKQVGAWTEAYVYGNYFWDRYLWDGTSNQYNACLDLTKSYGQYCTARVIEQGWEMKY